MTRSRTKTPITGITTAETEKADKLAANRGERRRIRQLLPAEPDILPHAREISSPWLMAKDGKQYLGNAADPKKLRK